MSSADVTSQPAVAGPDKGSLEHNELHDAVYLQEAMSLLDEEFVFFSSLEIQQVFDKFLCSYDKTWFALNTAESDGSLAALPVPFLEKERCARVVVAGQRTPACPIQSCRLRSELCEVQRQYQREHSEFQAWADGLFFSSDLDGKEQLLDADGAQVMMEWEKPYMIKCVDALAIGPDSDVLEIGFGCGYSAEEIQRARPRSHTIIECAGAVLKNLRIWASTRPNVVVVEGTWQEKLPELGVFDCVFFDDYGTPGRSDREMRDFCPDQRYKDEYTRATAKDHGTHFHAFLNIVLQWHSHEGSRISGYLEHPIDMQRPDVEAKFHSIPISPSPYCDYFPAHLCDTAVVPVFSKLGVSDESTESGSTRARASSGDNWSDSQSCSHGRSRSRSRSGGGKRSSPPPCGGEH